MSKEMSVPPVVRENPFTGEKEYITPVTKSLPGLEWEELPDQEWYAKMKAKNKQITEECERTGQKPAYNAGQFFVSHVGVDGRRHYVWCGPDENNPFPQTNGYVPYSNPATAPGAKKAMKGKDLQ